MKGFVPLTRTAVTTRRLCVVLTEVDGCALTDNPNSKSTFNEPVELVDS